MALSIIKELNMNTILRSMAGSEKKVETDVVNRMIHHLPSASLRISQSTGRPSLSRKASIAGGLCFNTPDKA